MADEKPSNVRKVLKNVEYNDITVDEAIHLLSKIAAEPLFQGVGRELKDPRIPSWRVNVSMRESLEIVLDEPASSI
jgi:hypothetical protein